MNNISHKLMFENNILYRFDLIVKYLYIKSYLNKYNTNFFIDLYKNHILTFNNGFEKDNNKRSVNDFINTFNKLITNISSNGFNSSYKIPIYNNLITNGAHRSSICYYLNITPEFISSHPVNITFDYNYFKNKKCYKPMDTNLLNFIALEGIKINKMLRCIIIFPKFIDNVSKIREKITKNNKIFYDNSFELTKLGLINLLKEAYRGEEWIGGFYPKNINTISKYKYVSNNKSFKQILHIFLLEDRDILNLKKEIRTQIGDHHCVHSTDFFIDTFRVCSTLLNKNSLYFINNINLDKMSNNCKNLLKKYFDSFDLFQEPDNFCVTSSIILDLFGLRQANDLDYLHINDKYINIDNIVCHKSKWLEYYPTHKDNIIFNPINHFYFNGYKFTFLNIIKQMKLKRNENKDIQDIKLIDKYLHSINNNKIILYKILTNKIYKKEKEKIKMLLH
jgi:hypothetical protein